MVTHLALPYWLQEAISEETVLAASPNADVIFGAMPDGSVLLYEVNADTVVASRLALSSLSGPVSLHPIRDIISERVIAIPRAPRVPGLR